MKCPNPNCNSEINKVMETRVTSRRRLCADCKATFWTEEALDTTKEVTIPAYDNRSKTVIIEGTLPKNKGGRAPNPNKVVKPKSKVKKVTSDGTVTEKEEHGNSKLARLAEARWSIEDRKMKKELGISDD